MPIQTACSWKFRFNGLQLGGILLRSSNNDLANKEKKTIHSIPQSGNKYKNNIVLDTLSLLLLLRCE